MTKFPIERDSLGNIVFKTAIILLFGPIATYYSVYFILYYKSEPTLSTSEIMLNKTITLPNAILCLPLYPGELYEYQLEYHPWNESQYPNSDEVIINDTALINNYFNQTFVSRDYFLNESMPWELTILHVMHGYLAVMALCESSAYREVDNENCSNRDNNWLNPINSTLARQSLEMNLRKLNVTIDEARQKFGKEVAQLYSIENVTLSRTVFVDDRKICYELDLGVFSQNIFVQISPNASTLPNTYNTAAPFFRGPMTIDFRKRYWLDSNYFGGIERPWYGQESECNLEIESIIRTLPTVNGVTRCSTNFSFDDCVATCRIKLIQKLCGCSATTWPKLLELTDIGIPCSLEQYRTCLNFNGFDDRNCTSSCLDLCETTTYKFILSSTVGDFPVPGSTSVTFSIKNFQYPVFEETLVYQTFDSFLGDFGGIIGLFLALDFFMIFNSLYNFVLFALRKFRKLKVSVIEDTNAVIEVQSQEITNVPTPKPKKIYQLTNFLAKISC